MDNDSVKAYIIYRNDLAIDTVFEGLTYTDLDVVSNQTYKYYLKAYDFSLNLSSPSNQVLGKTVVCGLSYAYYKGSWNVLPDFSSLTPFATGTTSNFDISVRDQNDNFAFTFEGVIKIFTPGEYTFYTSSDDGSKLYINNIEVVDNDELHGPRERSGKMNLNPGDYPIRVTYFEKEGSSEVLTVQYQGPGISKQNIPSAVLCHVATDDYLEKPTEISAVSLNDQEIAVTWQDNAVEESGYEIYRASDHNASYDLIAVTSQNVSSYTDAAVDPATTYYYQVKAVSSLKESRISAYQQDLFYSYYPFDVDNFDEPLFDGLTPSKTGYINTFSLAPRTKSTHFAFKYEGHIRILEEGDYVFYTNSDDGSQLYINGVKVVDNGISHGFGKSLLRPYFANTWTPYHYCSLSTGRRRLRPGSGL